MKNSRIGAAVAVMALVSLASGGARAGVIFSDGGVVDPTAGMVSAAHATTVDFDAGTGPLVANTGSILYTSGTTPGIAAAPFADTTGYASIGSNVTPQSATLTFAAPVNYLGFYWGSVDSFNSVTLYDGGTVIGTFTGSDAINPANGYQGFGGSTYANFLTTGGDMITSAVFSTTQIAFEIDSIASGVPEPSTWAMLVIGFAGLGFLGYRRRGNAVFRMV